MPIKAFFKLFIYKIFNISLNSSFFNLIFLFSNFYNYDKLEKILKITNYRLNKNHNKIKNNNTLLIIPSVHIIRWIILIINLTTKAIKIKN